MNFRRRSDWGRGKNIFSLILVVIIFGGVFAAISTSKVNVEEDGVKISGLYGITIKYEDIKEVAIKESLPKKLNRTNGIDFFGTYLGNFKAENMSKLRMFVKSKNSPVVYIRTRNDEHVMFNTKDKKQTEDLFNEISSVVKK